MSHVTGAAPEPRLDRAGRVALGAGGAALAGCVAAALLAPARFYHGWMVGWLMWLGIALGSLALLMLYHLTGGRWGLAIRRPLEAASRTLPLLALGFVPVLIGAGALFPWTHPEELENALVRHKTPYLNLPFFVVRAVLYFAVWTLLARRLGRLSREQDRTGDPALAERLRRTSGPGLVLWGLTMTFASFDWLMSMTPEWYSTMLGFIVLAGQGLSAMAFAIVVARLLAGRTPLGAVATPPAFHDLGNLLLMFVMFTTYVSFSQFLITWSGNLVEEIQWYLPRYRTSWAWLGLGLLVLYFFVPFFLLLSRRTKQDAGRLAPLAAGLLVMRVLELVWQVEPIVRPDGLAVPWPSLLAVAGIGGVWLAFFLWQLVKLPLVPVHDPQLEGAAAHD